MITEVEGLIVKESPYGDTSKIIQVLTREYGIISIMCKGAKSMKSRLRSLTMRFTYGIFHIYYKENKLSTLITVDIIDNFTNIKNDITLISYMAYLTELTTQVIKQGNDKDVYEEFINGIIKINNNLDPLVITNILELKLLPYLGVGLNLDSCVKCGSKNNIITIDGDAGGYLCSDCQIQERIVSPKTIKMLRMYYYVDIKSITELNISEEVKEEINFFLDKYYDRYTGLYLSSKEFLKTIANI
ncbi:MAG: DNA repair protein RecO [Bacilli bacterium]|nr:DNA repair protein RecO [Bacilli bacterium]